MEDQRREPRQKTLLRAEITTAQGTIYSCSVRDLSSRGARLSVGDVAWIPSTFKLRILGRDIIADAEVRWRNQNQMGVRFRSVRRLAAGLWVETQDVA